MKKSTLFVAGLAVAGLAAAGCGDDEPKVGFEANSCATVEATNCVEIAGGDSNALLTLVNDLEPNTTIVLGEGVFEFNNEVKIRTSGTHLVGQGIDITTLDFGPARELGVQANGVDVAGGTDFLIADPTILDTPKDGIRVEDVDGVVFRRIRSTWTNVGDTDSGAYGIYPVKSRNVLVEDSFAENASDAGLYVGQSEHVIVRNNVVRGNVAGLEIENTQYADVYGNTAEDNTGGIVVFDLPKNPIVGRDVRLRDNIIRNNNRKNFAPGGTVAMIPAGTGTFAMASRRVEITGNTYENNQTVDIAIISGLVTDAAVRWDLDPTILVGNNDGLVLDPGTVAGTVSNYRSENILIADNTHTGSGLKPDLSPIKGENGEPDQPGLGLGLKVLFGSSPISSVIYDTTGESQFSDTDVTMNSNDNHLCVGGNAAGSFSSIRLLEQLARPVPDLPILTVAAGGDLGPFGCTELDGGPVAEVTLPSAE